MAGNRLEPGRSTASRLLSVLEVFTAQAEELNLVEIAERAGMPVATTYRLIRELTTWGALERLANRRYRVGLRLWEVGSLAPRQRDLREVSRPYLQDLYQATRENVQVGVPDGNGVLIVEMVSGRNAVPTVTRVGGRLPLHATAVGKVTLAFSGPELHSPCRVSCSGPDDADNSTSPRSRPAESGALRCALSSTTVSV